MEADLKRFSSESAVEPDDQVEYFIIAMVKYGTVQPEVLHDVL